MIPKTTCDCMSLLIHIRLRPELTRIELRQSAVMPWILPVFHEHFDKDWTYKLKQQIFQTAWVKKPPASWKH